jgi:hypothetical protein
MRHQRLRPRSLATLVALAAVAALPACASGAPAPPAAAAPVGAAAVAEVSSAATLAAPTTTTPVPSAAAVPPTTVPTTTTTAPTTTTAATKAIGLPGDLPAPGSADSGEGDGSAAPYPLVAPAYGADDVVAALLASPNLTLLGFARQDLANGRVDPELTHLLLAITQEHRVTVSVFITGHSLCVHGGNTLPCPGSSISMHAYGRAVDILDVDGEAVSADSERAWDLLRAIVALPAAERPNEIGVPWRALDGQAGIFSDADHDHHLHLAFQPDGPITTVPDGFLPDALPPDVRCATPLSGSGSTGALLLAADGRTATVGGLPARGDACADLGAARAVDVALTADCQAAWVLDDAGRVHALGDAPLFGDASGLASVALLAGDAGYRIVTAGGRVLGFGDQPSLGDATDVADLGDRSVVAAAATPDGGGYWLLSDDGGILSFGDASFEGSLADVDHAAAPVAIAATADGAGYWILTADGAVFAFGDAPYLGAGPGGAVAIRATAGGYSIVTADGRVHGHGGPDAALDAPATAPDGSPVPITAAAICA